MCGPEPTRATEFEWGDLPDGGHWMTWHPPGHPDQEYVCFEGYLFDTETANMVGACDRCA